MGSRPLRKTAAVVALCLGICGGCAGGAEIPDLAGSWAMIQVYPEIAVLPFVGEVARASIVAQLVSVEQIGLQLVMTDRYCFTVIEDGTSLVRTEIPTAFMASLRPGPRFAQISATAEGVGFFQPDSFEVRGALLNRPVDDPLPATADDPRVIDTDEDGKPGLTVRVAILGLFETYVVQRVRYRLSGIVLDSDTIHGEIDWTNEQRTIGASNPLLRVETAGRPDPDPSRHRFLMARVPADYTCDDLRQEFDALRARALAR